ncbi:MAG: TlpA family protein disulfide reductase [Sulfurovum sp.]|nr:TlpA family protein disulfide reductase [Sulfurovum sp.]
MYSLLFIVILFMLGGCDDKKNQNSTIVTENTTQILQTDKNESFSKKNISFNGNVTQIVTHAFALSDLQQKSYKGTLNDKAIFLEGVNAPAVIFHFFATWCPPCAGEAPYLSDLQKKHPQELFIAGITVNDTPTQEILEKFIQENHADYYISTARENDALATEITEVLNLDSNFSLPLTVIYHNGKYLSHYEGAVPVEILEHDIHEAIKDSKQE